MVERMDAPFDANNGWPGGWLRATVLTLLIWFSGRSFCTSSAFWHSSGAQGGTISPLSPLGALGPRIAISAMLGLGILYFIMISWTKPRVAGWRKQLRYNRRGCPFYGSVTPPLGNDHRIRSHPRSGSMHSVEFPTSQYASPMVHPPYPGDSPSWNNLDSTPPLRDTQDSVLPPDVFAPVEVFGLRFRCGSIYPMVEVGYRL